MTQVSIGSLSDFPEGTPTRVEADGTALCIVRVGDTVHAICDDCPHAEASLSEGDFLADDMAKILTERYGVAGVVRHRKHSVSIPAAEDILKDVVERCDLVIAGSGD